MGNSKRLLNSLSRSVLQVGEERRKENKIKANMIGSLTQKNGAFYVTYRLQSDAPKYEIYWYPYFFSNGNINFYYKSKANNSHKAIDRL